MSDRIKNILSDPERRKELINGLNDLHETKDKKARVKIGNCNFELKSLNVWEDFDRAK